jgi:hypothetical protein
LAVLERPTRDPLLFALLVIAASALLARVGQLKLERQAELRLAGLTELGA